MHSNAQMFISLHWDGLIQLQPVENPHEKGSLGDAVCYGCSYSHMKDLNTDRWNLCYANETAFFPIPLNYLKYVDAANIWVVKLWIPEILLKEWAIFCGDCENTTNLREN